MQQYHPPIRAVIIDDEAGCIANLSSHIAEFCPSLKVAGTGQTLADARSFIAKQAFDVAFLDIELAEETAFDLFQYGTVNFPVVLVTAYDRYARRAFRIDALDYLLKPLCAEELIQCHTKIVRAFHPAASSEEPTDCTLASEPKLILKSGSQVYVSCLSDIVYLEGCRFYTKVVFWLNGSIKSVLLSKTLGQLLGEYRSRGLVRIHKSYAVNSQRVASITRTETVTVQMDTGERIGVARRRVQELMNAMTRQQ